MPPIEIFTEKEEYYGQMMASNSMVENGARGEIRRSYNNRRNTTKHVSSLQSLLQIQICCPLAVLIHIFTAIF